ncbi:MAG: hypothetical protein R3F17_16000 [Planctomycetota bacterium]
MWHLNFLARTLLVLLVLCGSAWPAQNPRWWQGEQEARFNDCLDRLDRDRLGPDYIPQLLERVESASITPQGESSDSAEAYLELLFLKINPTPALKANQDRNRNGEPYATWPSGWGMTRLTLPLIEMVGLQTTTAGCCPSPSYCLISTNLCRRLPAV